MVIEVDVWHGITISTYAWSCDEVDYCITWDRETGEFLIAGQAATWVGEFIEPYAMSRTELGADAFVRSQIGLGLAAKSLADRFGWT